MNQKTAAHYYGIKNSVLAIITIFAFSSSVAQNAIADENKLTGTAASTWDLVINPDGTYGDISIVGFATDISVNKGGNINFKVNINSGTDFNFDVTIYRLGFYQGLGARKIADLGNFNQISQAACDYDATTGNTDCGNWTVSASWAVPATAVSGLYIAKITRSAAGGGGSNHIAFIVRDDASTSRLLFKTSDATWQAYNIYGGNSLYLAADGGLANHHASKVSYNRPFSTRNGYGPGDPATSEDWLFNSEYPMIRFLESNGYDMTYTTDVDVAGGHTISNPVLNHNVFLSVGHDEYWSKPERDNVEAGRAAGKHVAFFSGNEVYWKTRWENSIDGTSTPFRTMVCYKEGNAPTPGENACGTKCDVSTNTWTGLWRDGCTYPGVVDACKPENGLSGEISWDKVHGTLMVPDTYKNLRFWRNTPNVATLASGQTAILAPGSIGYEWDYEQSQYASSYPAGRITMSSTLLDGRVNKLSLYKASSGALVFGAASVQWTWGLDGNHDRNDSGNNIPSQDMQQATVNLLADMGVQPTTLQSPLVAASASTDVTPPVSVITAPRNGDSLVQGTPLTIKGTVSDVGGVVAGLDISVDGGVTFQPATLNASGQWYFFWTPTTTGNITLLSRGFDDSGNIESTGGGEGSSNSVTVIVNPSGPPVNCHCTIFTPDQVPDSADQGRNDNKPITLGVKFKSSKSGTISAIRFYKTAQDTSSFNTVQLWTLGMTQLGSAILTNTPVPPGWTEVAFSSPIHIDSGTIYVASYYSPTGVYSSTHFAFTNAVVDSPLTAIKDTSNNHNGVYQYGPPMLFPVQNFDASNYWVDVKFTPNSGPDTIPPTISIVSPLDDATNVSVFSSISATFNESIDTTTVNTTTVELSDGGSAISGTVSYTVSSRTATLVPSSQLAYSTTYTVTIKGGSSGIKDLAGNAMVSDFVWSFTTSPPPSAPPDQGTGGPILIISDSINPFSRFPVEILRSEGYNAFNAKDISEVRLNPALLDTIDVVILGQMPLTGPDVTMLTNWVDSGGTLIALRPDAGLSTLLGITPAGGTLADSYLLIDTSAGKPGAGIVAQTIQFHDTADLYTLNGATKLATLYSGASTPTTNHNPAITLKNVGINGGQAIAFTYDLARSVVYTRQGNPAWAGQNRDGQIPPTRADNLFFPTWIDFNKVQIPQADEQQHLLTNIILLGNLHRKPLPHLWFLPGGLKAAVVMTGDDHNLNLYPGSTGTEGRFNEYMSLSSDNSATAVLDWKAIRGTSYIYNGTPIPDDSVAYYQSQGFEIGLHPTTYCLNYTLASLNSIITNQLSQLEVQMPSMTPPVTNRTHCLPWSDWSSHPKVENSVGMRFDVNYYYWPASWIKNRPGMFTGSGMPMRFADLDGSLIDAYQAPTVMTDESGMDITFNINTLLDNAINLGYYGAFVMNMHTDTAIHIGSNEIIASAVARNIPVISAKQMLTWLDNRNGTVFGPMTWLNNKLSFTITTSARNLQAIVPFNSATGTLINVTENGSAIPFTPQLIKGIQYGVFSAGSNSYVAIYSSTPLPITLLNFTVYPVGDDAQLNWTTSMEENNKGFEIQRSSNNADWTVIGFVNGAGNSETQRNYQYLDPNLAAGTYYYRLRQIDLDGHSQLSKIVYVTFNGSMTLELKQNRPNPFNNSTTIDIVIPKTCRVQLILYDQLGRPVQTLLDEEKAPGQYSIQVNRNGQGSGVYYYRMNAMGQSMVRKMTLF